MSLFIERKTIRKLPGTVIKAVPIPEPELIQGFGFRNKVGSICKKAGYKSVLLVTDETLFSLGLHKKVESSLKRNGINYSIFHSINEEPNVEIVEAGRQAALDCEAECIIALGGGSVLDSSKIISASAKHSHLPMSYFLLKFAMCPGGTLPMINIPSTAGTGAECTVGVVVKNSNDVKTSTVVVGLTITHVILDSELIINAPRDVTAWCAIDALSHGLENLPVLLEDPQNIEARQATLLAANYGGNAINKQLAGYVHAFAHSIGALYHIPHGKACEDEVDAADKLVKMIDADSINYSPSRTFTDSEVRMILDQIRRGN